MPAKSGNQRRAAGMALAARRGEMPMSRMKGAAGEMAKSMTVKQLREFASKPKGGRSKK